MELLDNLIIQDSSDDDENTTEESPNLSSQPHKLIGLVVAFCLTFRVVHNIPDRAITLLLRFFKHIFLALGRMFQIEQFGSEMNIPQSIHKCYDFLGLQKDPYIEYASCSSCHLLFDSNALLASHSRPELITCPYVEFPNHPQQRFRLPCNTFIFNKIQKKGGDVDFKPRRGYYYHGLKSAFSVLLNRSDFLTTCNLWFQNRHHRSYLAEFGKNLLQNFLQNTIL